MSAVGPLQLALLVAVAGAAAMGGFIAAAVVLRNKRRARGYFMLGVITGLVAAEITRGRYRKVRALGAVVCPQRSRARRGTGPFGGLGLASQLRRVAERTVAR